MSLDLIGVMVLTKVVFQSLEWSGLHGEVSAAAFVAANLLFWLFAASVVQLYSLSRMISGQGMAIPTIITFAIAFAPAFLVAVIGFRLYQTPPAWVPVASCFVLAWLLPTRLTWIFYIRGRLRSGQCLEKVVLLAGSVVAARLLAAELEHETDGRTRAVVSAPIPGIPGGPSIEWVRDIVRNHKIDKVLISDCPGERGFCNSVLLQLRQMLLPASVEAYTGLPSRILVTSAHFGNDAPVFYPSGAQIKLDQMIAKRAIDLVLATTALVVISPALIAIALAIKANSPGPVLFKQRRVGLHGTEFLMWKFRTMYTDKRDDLCFRQTSRDDPRVTKVGRFLRRTSLDELPQLANVLSGDMSLVGPRPHALGMTVAGQRLVDLVAGYNARHRVRPGITGWAQVHGCRGEVNGPRKLRRRVALDCYYIDNWTLSMDMKIIIRTAVLLFADRHAY